MSVALQLCPFAEPLERGLGDLFEVVRWFALGEDQQSDFLSRRADEVVAVATGGHIGCPPPLMDALPCLGIVAINGVGYDKVDLDQARARGVRVTNTPDVLTEDVADLAVGMTIDLLRGITPSDRFVREGEWLTRERPLTRRVAGKRFGIVGLGRIGRAIADRLACFGSIRYFGRSDKGATYSFEPSLVALAEWADVLLVACAANPDTRRLIDGGVLAALGSDGVLVNVARGAVVDEAALIAALNDGTIAGAALDVFEDEPRVPQALLDSARVLLTPHIASATVECRVAMADIVLANLRAFLAGELLPTAVV